MPTRTNRPPLIRKVARSQNAKACTRDRARMTRGDRVGEHETGDDDRDDAAGVDQLGEQEGERTASAR